MVGTGPDRCPGHAGGNASDVVVLDAGRLLVRHDCFRMVEGLGIRTVKDALSLSGTLLRDLPDRRNVLVGDFEPGIPRYYLKVLKSGSRRGRLFRSARRSIAVREFELHREFLDCGLSVPRAIAAGYDPSSGDSFLLTEEVDAITLDRWMARVDPVADRRAYESVLRRVAELTRKMHRCGFFHRDFYLCHLLLEDADDCSLVVIDLERVLVRPLFRGRWRVKDLAALLSSVDSTKVSRSDIRRFLAIYFGGDRPRGADLARMLQRIARKERRIRAHVPKKVRMARR